MSALMAVFTRFLHRVGQILARRRVFIPKPDTGATLKTWRLNWLQGVRCGEQVDFQQVGFARHRLAQILYSSANSVYYNSSLFLESAVMPVYRYAGAVMGSGFGA